MAGAWRKKAPTLDGPGQNTRLGIIRAQREVLRRIRWSWQDIAISDSTSKQTRSRRPWRRIAPTARHLALSPSKEEVEKLHRLVTATLSMSGTAWWFEFYQIGPDGTRAGGHKPRAFNALKRQIAERTTSLASGKQSRNGR